MDEVTLTFANEFGLCVFAYGSDVPLRVYNPSDTETRRFRMFEKIRHTSLRSIDTGSFSVVFDLGAFSSGFFKVNLYALTGTVIMIFCLGAPNPLIKSIKLSVFSMSKSPIRREG
ncbi:hypothetical protein ALC57_16904 [Trachymyrmex cornetzi]|uniref:Uncharacterized protein n=1 Tax=Trachymyrmex cornetzi TaxID=471704 RepID=A0A151IUB2_9HYME|nr:hypothetical protein ALC57_16904 [Trachymyrmex cornetzi]